MGERAVRGRPKLRVTGEHATDVLLWSTATYLLRIGTHRRKGYFHVFLAASLFAFFAFEAYLNEVGEPLAPEIWTSEREFFKKRKYRGTLGKFKYLAEKTGYKYSTAATSPFQSVRQLAEVRDQLAHGRRETFDVMADPEHADSIGATPKLMAWGERSFAKRAVADVQTLADGLMAAAKATCGEWAAGYRSSAFVGVRSSRSISLEDR